MAWSGISINIDKDKNGDSDSDSENVQLVPDYYSNISSTSHEKSPCMYPGCTNSSTFSVTHNSQSGNSVNTESANRSHVLPSSENSEEETCDSLCACNNSSSPPCSLSTELNKGTSLSPVNCTSAPQLPVKMIKTFTMAPNNSHTDVKQDSFIFKNSPAANHEIASTSNPRNLEVSCIFSVVNECNVHAGICIHNTPDSAVQTSEQIKPNNSSVNGMENCKHVEVTSNGLINQPLNMSPFYNWQATMTTVKERFAFLFNNEILSDVHFRVIKGDVNQRIPAHKFVLSVGSAVFDAMFNGKLSTNEDEITLPDVEPQAFLALLRFLYSDEVQIGPESVMTVLYTAKKYAVPALERHCIEFLKCNLSPDNAFMLLTQARLFDEPQLAALCLDTIDKNTSESLLADGFYEIDHNTLCLVLERDTLRIREAKLFQAVVKWSEHECERQALPITPKNQRQLLDKALLLIRFPLMSIEEFAQGPAQSNILTDREIVELFLFFTVNPKPKVQFLDIPRCCMTGKEQTVCRFQQIESRWGYSGTSDRIRFIVDRRIFVAGFGMYGSIHGPSEYEIIIQIIHTATGKICASNDTTFTSDGTFNTFRVMFKEPVEVLPNTNYTAYATLKGPDSHYGTKGVRKISVECPSGDRVTFQFTYAAGNNNGTSVEDGQIPELIFYT